MKSFLKFLGLAMFAGVLTMAVVGCQSDGTDELEPIEDEYYEEVNNFGDGNNGGGLDGAGFTGYSEGASEGAVNSIDDLEVRNDLNFPIIYFPYDSNEIIAREATKLEKVVEYMNKHTILYLIIQGHCDQRGTEEYNRGLGERRANQIRDYLVTQGISSNRIQTVSYGKDKPLVEGNSEEAWGQNRRGELYPAIKKAK